MTYQHTDLAAGRWQTLTLMEQLANVGSEVIRALRWQTKRNTAYQEQAFYRALELLSLTIDDPKHRQRLKELTRLYETLVDYFAGANSYRATARQLEEYFIQFTYAARRTV
jgi:hypothetical protein